MRKRNEDEDENEEGERKELGKNNPTSFKASNAETIEIVEAETLLALLALPLACIEGFGK